jgi:cytoskeleton protein RodZ
MENGSLNTDLTASGLAEDVAMANPVIAEPGIAIGSVNVSASFNGDCWFDLRDRNNDRIVGLYRSGDSVNFNGEYPLKFVVGAVNAVTIRVNNKSLDFADYPVKNNRAQFTLER